MYYQAVQKVLYPIFPYWRYANPKYLSSFFQELQACFKKSVSRTRAKEEGNYWLSAPRVV